MKVAPPIEAFYQFDLFFATGGDKSCSCCYCGRALHWREIGLHGRTRYSGIPVLVVCLECGYPRARQNDCRVRVMPGCTVMYDEMDEVNEMLRANRFRWHTFCGDMACHLCNQDLRLRV